MNKLNLRAKCPKCWATADRIRVEYKADVIRYPMAMTVEAFEIALQQKPEPYMLRTCSRCQYSWRELPLDSG